MAEQNEFLAAGQTMTVGELRLALATRDARERVNVFVLIADEAVVLENLVKVTHHQPFSLKPHVYSEYRSVCLHISRLAPRWLVSTFTF